MKLRLPLALSAAVLAACSFSSATYAAVSGNSISINFAANQGEVGNTTDALGPFSVQALYWNNAWDGAAALSTDATKFNKNDSGQEGKVIDNHGTILNTIVGWKAGNGGSWSNGTNSTEAEKLQRGYMDDGGNGSAGGYVTIKDVPYLMSTVYVLCNGDGGKFAAMNINGTIYAADASGNITTGTAVAWGTRLAIAGGVWTKGVNYLQAGINGVDISISTVATASGRGTVAGVQVVDAYDGTMTNHTLVAGASNWATVVTGGSTAQTFTANSGGSTLNITTASTDGIILMGNTLTLSGGTLTLTGPASLNAFTGTTLNIATTLASAGTISFGGAGTIVLQQNQTISALGGAANVTIANGVNLSVANTTAFTGSFSGSGTITKTGAGNIAISGTSFTGTLNLQGGGLIYGSATATVTDFNYTSLPFTLTVGASSSGVMVYLAGDTSDSGGSSSAFGTLTLGSLDKITIKSGLANVNTSSLGSAVIHLDGGGFLNPNTAATPVPAVSNAIVVDAGGGFLRNYGNAVTDYNGAITGSGPLVHTDGGIINLNNTTGFTGSFRNAKGTTNFNSAVALSGFSSAAGAVTFAAGTTSTVGGAITDPLLSSFVTGGTTFTAAGTLTGNNWRLTFGNATANITGNLTLNEFVMTDGNNGPSVVNVQTGGTLSILGSRNTGDGRNGSFQIGHWALVGTLNIAGGTLNSLNAIARNVAGTITWNISAGTANVYGIDFTGGGGTVNLNLTGGRINLGSYGMTGAADNKMAHLGAGTVGALTDWSSAAQMELTDAATGVTFNTADTITPSNPGRTITLTGILKGTGRLVKDGKGTLVLAGANIFEGGLGLKNGTLSIANDAALGLSGKRNLIAMDKGSGEGGILYAQTGTLSVDTFTLMSGAKFNLGGSATAQTLNVLNNTTWNPATGATLVMDGGDLINVTGTLTLSNTVTLDMSLGNLATGSSYTLVSASGGITGGSNFQLNNTSSTDYRAVTYNFGLDGASKNLVLNITGGGAASIVWKNTAATGNWEIKGSTSKWTKVGVADYFYQGDTVLFDDTGVTANQAITLATDLLPGGMTVNNSAYDYAFTGGTLSPSGAFVKSGSKNLTFTSTTVTIGLGKTATVSGGTLTLGTGTVFNVQGSFSNTSNLAFTGGSLNLAQSSDATVSTGTVSSFTGGALTYGGKTLLISASAAGVNFGNNITGTGTIMGGSGSYAVAFTGRTTDLDVLIYAGKSGVTFAGQNSKGIYGGYSAASEDAAGLLTIGSTTASVLTTVTGKIAGANYNLGATLEAGASNSTVLTKMLVQGALTESQIFDSSRDLKSDVLTNANTQITGTRLYGGGSNTPAIIYGSVETTLSGIYLLGGTPDYLGGNSSCLVAGGDLNSTIFGNVKLTIANSYIASRVYGSGYTINGNITFNFSNSYFTQDIMMGGSGGGVAIGGTVTLTDVGSTIMGSIYGGRDGSTSLPAGKVTIDLTGTQVRGNVYASPTVSNNYYNGADIILNNAIIGTGTTAGVVSIAYDGRNVKGNSSITIKGTSKANTVYGGGKTGTLTGDLTLSVSDTANVGTLYGAGNAYSVSGNVNISIGGTATIGNFRGVGYKSSVQNLAITITGGTIGAGKTGTSDNMFFVSGQNTEVAGTATLTMSGGSIQNDFMILGGVDVFAAGKASIEGLTTMNVSGGSIESNIRATSGWGGFLGSDVDIKLSGGTFGKAGQTRSIDMGIAEGDWSGAAVATPVKGNVKITLDGGSSGQGSTFLGTYSILAGATLGSTGVVGSTTVTLQNVTSKNADGTSGVANFAGVISGANNSGTGAGASRSLVFSNYTTETSAQFKYFSTATVKDASNVLLKGAGTSIASWTVSDTSTLTFQTAATLGGATAISLDNGATLKYVAASGAGDDELSASTAISGGGSLVIDTSAAGNSFGISNANTGFTGTTTIAANSYVVLWGAATLGTGQININAGGTLDLTKSADWNVTNKVTGTGNFDIWNEDGKTTTLSNTASTFTGNFTVYSGILSIADGVKFASSTVTMDTDYGNSVLALNAANLNGIFSSIHASTAGEGTVLVKNANATLSDSTFASYTGILSVGTGNTLTVSVGASNIGAGVNLDLQGGSHVVLNNTSGAAKTLTLSSLSATDTGNTITLGGANPLTLTFTTQNWMTLSTGEVTFDRGDGTNHKVMTGNSALGVYTNVFIIEDGTVYQSKTDASGYLIKLTLDDMDELPAVGRTDTGVTAYKITGPNSVAGVLTMTGATKVSSLNIKSVAGTNTQWNLNGQTAEVSSGALFFQGDADYVITGGTLKGSSTRLSISQTSTTNTLTINATIADNGGATLVQKMGAGKLVLAGPLSNTGGVAVVTGTLQLQGLATGSNTLTNNATLLLGDGSTAYTSGFTSITNIVGATASLEKLASLGTSTVANAGTFIVKQGATLTNVGNITNTGTLDFQLGTENKSLAGVVAGTGTIKVTSGTATFTEKQSTTQALNVQSGATAVMQIDSAVATIGAVTGTGSVVLKNSSAGDLDAGSAAFGSDWKNFGGTLTLETNASGSFRNAFSTAVGETSVTTPTIIVKNGAQFWDGAPSSAIRKANWNLTGKGWNGTGEGLGALRLADGATYTGNFVIDATGAGIGGPGGTATISGNISGGILALGAQSSGYSWNPTITLSGTNSQAATAVYRATVNLNSASAAGQGLNMALGGYSANLNADVSTGFLEGVASTTVSIASGKSLTLTGSVAKTFAGKITGTGNLTLNHGATGSTTLSGASDFTGNIAVNSGTLVVSNVTGLGNAANIVTVKEGATLDMGSVANTNAVNISTVANLANFNHYAGTLTINGAAGKTTTVTGGLSAMKLNLTTANAKVAVNGNLVVQNGGSFYLDAANVDQPTALIAVSGTASMGGEFKIAFNTSDAYVGDTLVYNVVSSASGSVANYNNSLAFTVNMAPIYQRFFTLRSTCVEDFMNTGNLYIVIDRLVVIGDLITVPQGPNSYGSAGQLNYLGAQDPAVEFTGSYNISSGDDAYRLTNGLGWLTFNSSTQLKDINASTPTALVINTYTDNPSATDDRGVIMLAKDNIYTGGTSIFNVIVKSDASGATGEVKTFGSGEISLLGNKADFVLTGDPTADYSYENDFRLTDGSTITQDSGANTLNGDIYIATQGAGGNIANTGDETLTLTGKLSGGNLTVQGDGEVDLSGALTSGRTLTGLSLIDSADFNLTDGANLTVGTLSTEAGSDIWVNTDTDFTISGGSAIGDGNINLNGGTLHVTRNLGLNGAGQTKLVFHPEPFTFNVVPGNVIDVASGSTLTVTNATADANTSFTKIGAGTVTFTGDSSLFFGTAKALEGTMNVFATTGYDFGGNLEVGGGTNDSRLIIQNGIVVKGDITVHEKGILSTSNNFVLEGNLTLTDNAAYSTDGKASYMGDITLGKNAKLTLAEGSLLGYDNAMISMDKGSVFNFGTGAGSQFAGVLDGGGIIFTEGSTYEGFLNANGNNVTFMDGSFYNVSGSMRYKTAGSFTGALQSQETISLAPGMEFTLNNFTVSNMERYADGFCLMSVSGPNGKILYDGISITEDGDYSNLLGANPYQWLQFSLIGGTDGKTLDLGVFTRAQYEGLAGTGNEKAIAPVANELANNFGNIDGSLKQLGGALALATGNAKEMLSKLALSTSSAMVGYQVQIDNLRRHAFDTLNRAVQEQTGAQRLSYEQDQNTIWANAVGGTYQLDDNSNSLGNTTTLWGGTLGFSRAVGEDLAAGLAFTYTNSQTDLNNGFGRSTGDAYYIDAFARYNKDNWNVVGILTGGFTSVDVERNMTVGSYHSNTKGSADGSQFYALLQAGYQFAMSDDNRSYLEPFALITGGYSSLDGFDETGAGNAGLSVDSQSQGLCTIGAGVRFFRDFYTDTNELHRGRFEARAMVLQDMIDSDVNVDAGFIGLPSQRFSQEGMSPGRTAFVIGTGVVVPVSVQTSIFGDVDAEFRTSETGVRANIGVKVTF